jgi:ABC-2 type transport system permease protein
MSELRRSLRKALIVARREYIQRVRTRSFAIMTVIVAVLGIGIVMLPLGFRLLAGESQVRVGVVDQAGDLSTPPVAALSLILDAASAGPSGALTGRYVVEAVESEDSGRAAVTAGHLDGLLTIRRDASRDLAFDYFSKAAADDPPVQILRQATAALAIEDRLVRAGIQPSQQAGLFSPPTFQVTPVDPAAGSANAGATILGFVLNILIFTAILTYGYWVATSVAEEKGSRVMELLVQAATPNQLLAGKVLGAGASGLTQYLALIAGGAVGLVLQAPLSTLLQGDRPTTPGLESVASSISVSLPVLLAFGAYFVLGFTLYAGLYAAAGSLVGRVQDAQQVGTPITMLAMVGYLGTTAAATSPGAPWVAVMSQIPFWSPSFMVFRLASGNVTPAEIALSFALLVGGIVLVLLIAARIYRAGVLLYGQKPTLRSLFAAARSR